LTCIELNWLAVGQKPMTLCARRAHEERRLQLALLDLEVPEGRKSQPMRGWACRDRGDAGEEVLAILDDIRRLLRRLRDEPSSMDQRKVGC